MTLTYINYSSQPVACTTQFYSDSGGPLPLPFSAGTMSTRTDVLQAGQSIHDQTISNPGAPVSQGWAHPSCTGPVQASLLYRLFKAGGTLLTPIETAIGEAAVNPETAPTSKFVTFAETQTGVADGIPSAIKPPVGRSPQLVLAVCSLLAKPSRWGRCNTAHQMHLPGLIRSSLALGVSQDGSKSHPPVPSSVCR